MQDFRRFRYLQWLMTVGVCAVAFAMISGNLPAVERGILGFTETGGGVPAPVSPPRPAVKNFNPKETTVFAIGQDTLFGLDFHLPPNTRRGPAPR